MPEPVPSAADPTLVFDLDGTLAETAGDVIRALNVVLAEEGIAAVSPTSARWLLGAGGRALIARGFASAGRPLEAPKLETLFADFLAYYNAHIADESCALPRRRGLPEPLRRGGLAARRLHQQARTFLASLARQARRRRPLRLRLRPGHVRRRQARSQAAAGDHPQSRRRSQARGDGRRFAHRCRDRARRRERRSSPSISAIPTSPSPNSGRTG